MLDCRHQLLLWCPGLHPAHHHVCSKQWRHRPDAVCFQISRRLLWTLALRLWRACQGAMWQPPCASRPEAMDHPIPLPMREGVCSGINTYISGSRSSALPIFRIWGKCSLQSLSISDTACVGVQIGGFFTSIPPAILGGMTTFLFASVCVSGIKIVTLGGLSRRVRFITAVALGLGLGVTIVPAWATNHLWPVVPSMSEALRSFR